MPSIVPRFASNAQMKGNPYEKYYELAIVMLVVIGAAIFLIIKFCFLRSFTKNKQGSKMDKDRQAVSKRSHTPSYTPTPCVPITIAGNVIPCVWGTGSEYSYIKVSLAKKLFSLEQILPTNERAKAMGGKPFKFIGMIKCTVKIGSLELPHTFFVVPDHFITEALLGFDFMTELENREIESSLRFSAGTLTLGKEVIALCMKDGRRYQSKVYGEPIFELPSLYSVR